MAKNTNKNRDIGSDEGDIVDPYTGISTHDRFSLFGAKPKSNLIQSWKSVNRLIPKEYRQTHEDFHICYKPLADVPGCDFNYTTFGRNKKTRIYEQISNVTLPYAQNGKGDGVENYSFFSGHAFSLSANLLFKLFRNFSFYPASYHLEYYHAENAVFTLNARNLDYLYELMKDEPVKNNKSVLEKISHEDYDEIISHEGIMELERERGTLRFYLFSEDARKKLLADKKNVLYFADESHYSLKDIYRDTDPELLNDFDVMMRFMILGPKKCKLSQALKDNPEFMLKVAQNGWLFGKGKGKGKGKNNKNGKKEDEYLYHEPLGREDFFAFFQNYQCYPEVSAALKRTLSEHLVSQDVIDTIYEQVIPEKYRKEHTEKEENENNTSNSNGRANPVFVNWQKVSMSTWRFKTFVCDALLNRYLIVNSGEIQGGYPAHYQNSRFCDMEVAHPDVYLNTHDRKFLMALKEEEKSPFSEMLNIHSAYFEALMNDKEFLLTQKISHDDVPYLSEAMKKDADVAIHALHSMGEYNFYNQVGLTEFEHLNNNREVVCAFAQRDAKNFAHASLEMRKDKDLVTEIIRAKEPHNKMSYSSVYHYADDSVKEDYATALLAVIYGQTLGEIADSLKDDEMQHEALQNNLHNYHYTTSSFRNKPENEELGIKAFNRDEKIYALLPETLKTRHDFACRALTHHVSLNHCPDEFKDDLDMVLLALSVNQDNYQYCSERLRDDEPLLMIATTRFWVLKNDDRYQSLLEKIEEHNEKYELNYNFITSPGNVQYASNRLQQRFGSNDPYDYLKKEERAQSLTEKLDAMYGVAQDDRDDNSIWNMDEENNGNSNNTSNGYSRPMKI